MNEIQVIGLARETLTTSLRVAAPVLVVSLIIGIVVSLIQVATSVQDITLTFVRKMVAVAAVLLVAFTWMMHSVVHFASRLLTDFPAMLR
ncbi:MAG: flagellar biosynthetic protein FliQ [Acidobacteriota bacterium]